jgi:hypothetical protein
MPTTVDFINSNLLDLTQSPPFYRRKTSRRVGEFRGIPVPGGEANESVGNYKLIGSYEYFVSTPQYSFSAFARACSSLCAC